MSYKVEQLETPIGTLKVGDSVKLSFCPQGVDNENNHKPVQKIFAIWTDGEYHSFAFDTRGIINAEQTWTGTGIMEDDFLEIIPKKINNWMNEL